MADRLRRAWRWWPWLYAAFLAAGAGADWASGTRARLQDVLAIAVALIWFAAWRAELRRSRHVALCLERIRAALLRMSQARYPCPRCLHYACRDDGCESCGGTCLRQQQFSADLS